VPLIPEFMQPEFVVVLQRRSIKPFVSESPSKTMLQFLEHRKFGGLVVVGFFVVVVRAACVEGVVSVVGSCSGESVFCSSRFVSLVAE